MNMKFLGVVTPLPAIYHDCSTWKTLWEENCKTVKMTSCGRHNVIRHSEIKDGEQFITLYISFNIYFMDKRKVDSSEPKDYMLRPSKGITTYLAISTKRSNRKQKARFTITAITRQYLSKLLKKFEKSPYLGYKSKQVHNEPTEA